MVAKRILLAVFASLACLPATIPAFAQGGPARIEAPDVRVGDTWIYNKLDGWRGELEDISVNTVTQSDRNGIVMQSSSLDGKSVAKILRTTAFNLVRVEAPKFTQQAEPFYPNYSFPLFAGKTWKGTVVLTNTNQPFTVVTAEFEGQATGWEMVTVPAGNFLALKLEMKGTYNASGIGANWDGGIEDTLWYSPEVRNAVRYEYKDSVIRARYNHEIHELVKFWPGR